MDSALPIAQNPLQSTLKLNSRGEELRSLIATAQRDLKRWQAELQIYSRSITPIERIPPETLSEIFKWYLVDKPRLIRRILFVSRRWYQVAISDPSLWTHLSIDIDSYETELSTYVDGVMPYTVACLQYSKSMLLHIRLNLRSLQSLSTPEHREAKMKSLNMANLEFLSLFATSSAPSGLAPSDALCFENGSHIEDLIYILVGCDSHNLRRWCTLDLVLPDDQSLSSRIWNILRGSAPNLRHLSIQKSIRASMFSPILGGVVDCSLKDLHQLKSLRLRGIEDYSKLPVSSTILSDLDFESAMDESSIKQLQIFRNLRSLRIHSALLRSRETVHTTVTLSLLILEEIHFFGDHRFGAIVFNFPALRRLYICDVGGKIFDSLPDLTPPDVHFFIPLIIDDRNRDAKEQAVITRIARKYPNAKSLTIHAYDVKKQEGHLAHLTESGVLPFSLTTRVCRGELEWQ